MRPSSYLLIALAVTLVFTAAWFIVADFRQQYPEVGVNETWSEIYEETQESVEGINSTTSRLTEAIEKMASDESSFLDKIVGGAVLLGIIPYMAVQVIIQGGKTAILLPMVASAIGVPAFVISILIIMFWVVIIFAIITILWRFNT